MVGWASTAAETASLHGPDRAFDSEVRV